MKKRIIALTVCFIDCFIYSMNKDSNWSERQGRCQLVVFPSNKKIIRTCIETRNKDVRGNKELWHVTIERIIATVNCCSVIARYEKALEYRHAQDSWVLLENLMKQYPDVAMLQVYIRPSQELLVQLLNTLQYRIETSAKNGEYLIMKKNLKKILR